MKTTILRCVTSITAAVLAAGVLLGVAATTAVSQAGGIHNQESCVSSVEYACPPPPPSDFPME